MYSWFLTLLCVFVISEELQADEEEKGFVILFTFGEVSQVFPRKNTFGKLRIFSYTAGQDPENYSALNSIFCKWTCVGEQTCVGSGPYRLMRGLHQGTACALCPCSCSSFSVRSGWMGKDRLSAASVLDAGCLFCAWEASAGFSVVHWEQALPPCWGCRMPENLM